MAWRLISVAVAITYYMVTLAAIDLDIGHYWSEQS